MLLSLIAGMGAWRVRSWSFVYLLGASGIHLAGFKAIAHFPAATLAAAASMLPGGLGSTEATLVALLTLGGTLAAVGIRLATLWLATVMGMRAFGRLEGLVIGLCRRSRSTEGMAAMRQSAVVQRTSTLNDSLSGLRPAGADPKRK